MDAVDRETGPSPSAPKAERGEPANFDSSTHQFRELVESLPQLVWTCRADGYCDYLSPQWIAYTGVPEAEQLGSGWLARLHPDDLQQTVAKWQTAVATVSRYEVELRIRRADGVYRWFQTGAVPMRDASGSVVKWFGTNTDIEDRKRSEAALRDSESRFRGAFEHTNVAMVLTDIDNRFVRVNAAFGRMFGYAPDEMLGMTMADVTHPDHLAESYTLREALLTGLTDHFVMEKRYLHRDGRVLWGLTNVSLLRDADGHPFEYVGQVQDITERKRGEQQLRDTTGRLRALMNALPVGVSFSDDTTCQRITGNPAVLTQFAVTPDDNLSASAPDPSAPGRRVSFFHAGKPLADTELPLQRAVAENRAVPPVEMEVVMPNGRRWFMEASGAPIRDDGGTVIAGVAVTVDVTERKRAEEQVRQLNSELEGRVAERTAQLEAANKEWEAFSYSVSHDLRAPLRAIDGFSRIVMEDFGPQLPPEAREYLEDVRNGARLMGRLVDDLLAFSRLGRKPVAKQTVDMCALVGGCRDELRVTFADRRVEIRLGDLPHCAADPSLLKQVWLNLLSNAIKYSAGRDPAVIEIGATAGTGGPTYYVRDNGVGFDMRYAHKLFGVFQRLHRAEEFEGTGVGLAVVQRVIHRHGGRVWAEAEPDRGATFFFTLPAPGSDILGSEERVRSANRPTPLSDGGSHHG